MIFCFVVLLDGLCSNFGLDEGVIWLLKVLVWYCVRYIMKGVLCGLILFGVGLYVNFYY